MGSINNFTSDFMYNIICSDEFTGQLGDLNSDGLINILDIISVINVILELNE